MAQKGRLRKLKRDETTRVLKRVLKGKIKIVIGLLVSFLISGVVSFGAPDRKPRGDGREPGDALKKEPDPSDPMENQRADILGRITAERGEILTLIAENEAKLKEIQESSKNPVRKGDYYGKPIERSEQIFFTVFGDFQGRMKDRTPEAFVGGLDQVRGDGGNRTDLEQVMNYELFDVSQPEVKRPDAPLANSTGAPNVSVALPQAQTSFTPPVEIQTPSVGNLDLPGIEVDSNGPVAPEVISPEPQAGLVFELPTVRIEKRVPEEGQRGRWFDETPKAPDAPNFSPDPAKLVVKLSPLTLDVGEPPEEPKKPEPDVFTPVNLTFHGAGFDQSYGRRILEGGDQNKNLITTVINNYEQTKALGPVNITIGEQTSWDQDFVTNWSDNTGEGNTLPAGSTNEMIYAFLSHVEDWEATVEGEYTVTAETGGADVKIFASVKPFRTGIDPDNNGKRKVYEFTGTLTLKSPDGNSGNLLIGLEHKLLANDPDDQTYQLKNSGTITLAEGSHMAGVMLDTEYFTGKLTGPEGSAFVKLPTTDNSEGVIHILSGVSNSVGIDYGYYMIAENGGHTDGEGPNSTVKVGSVIVEGSQNYGVRLNDYSQEATDQGYYGRNYYNLTRIEGTPDRYIEVKGSENIGFSMAQGRSQGDPTGSYGHLGDDGSPDQQDLIAGLNIRVGGTDNVGFYRSRVFSDLNPEKITLDGSKIGDVCFADGAEGGALYRSDSGEIELNRDTEVASGGVGNTALQAAGTGVVTLKNDRSITASASQTNFYGMTAGNFAGSTGAKAVNHGEIRIDGDDSYGMAIAGGNEGENTGVDTSGRAVRSTIEMNGTRSTGIFNQGNLEIHDANIDVVGDYNTAIYHGKDETQPGKHRAFDSPETKIQGNTGILATGAGAIGVYSNADGLLMENASIIVQGKEGSKDYAVGIYNAAGKPELASTKIWTWKDAIGIYNKGDLEFDADDLILSGTNTIGIYQAAGNAELSGTIVSYGEKGIGLVYEDGTINADGFDIQVSNSGVGLYNKGDLTGGVPVVTLAGSGSTGYYNDVGATMSVTEDFGRKSKIVEGSDLYEDIHDLVGICNAGVLAEFSASFSLDNASSVGIYNKGLILNYSGSISVSGKPDGISVAVYNESDKYENPRNIDSFSGTITAGSYAAAIYNSGEMYIDGGTIMASADEYAAGIYNVGAGRLHLLSGVINISVQDNAVGLYNSSDDRIFVDIGNISVAGDSAAGIYHNGNGTLYLDGSVCIETRGSGDAGICVSNEDYGFFHMIGGTIDVVGDGVKTSAGIYEKGQVEIHVFGGTINTTGNNTVGIYNAAFFASHGGNIYVTGESSVGIYNGEGTLSDMSIEKANQGKSKIVATGRKAVGIYGNGATMRFMGGIVIEAHGGASGIYAHNGEIPMGWRVKINVENDLPEETPGAGEGVGLYVSEGWGAYIQETEINVNGGSAAVVAKGTGTNRDDITRVRLLDSKISYTGDGYAFWTEGDNVTIDLTGSEIALGGNAVGMRVVETNLFDDDKKIITWDNAKIKVTSKDVALLELVDYTGPLDVAALKEDVLKLLGDNVQLTEDSDKTFKLAWMEGGSLNLSGLIDAADAEDTAGYNFFRRFAHHGVNLTADGTADIRAVISTAQADAIFGEGKEIIGIGVDRSIRTGSSQGSVVTLEPGAQLTVARTDTDGPGAIGVYVDRGEIAIKSGASVKVQEEDDGVFGGIGLYSDFNQKIQNDGTITVGGESGIGIYARDNPSYGIRNNGTITVASGKDPEHPSFGILSSEYGDVYNEGTISVGNNGIGIYSYWGVISRDENKKSYGTIKMGGNSIGVYLTGATFGGSGLITFVSDDPNRNKVGIFPNTMPYIAVNIDGSAFTGGANLYFDSRSSYLYFAGNSMQVGENGVGIYLAKGESAGRCEVFNKGVITLGEQAADAIGIYAESGTLYNDNTIELEGSGQYGLVGDGSGVSVTNEDGHITLSGTNSAAIYLRDGAKLLYSGDIRFLGDAGGNIALVLSGATQLGSDEIAVRNDSSARNMGIVYTGEGGMTNSHGAPLTLSGDKLTGICVSGHMILTNDKPIAYADGSNLIGAYAGEHSEYVSTSSADVIATPNSVGIYSGGGRAINRGTLTVDGAGSSAMAADGGILANAGTIDVNHGAGAALLGPDASFDGSGGAIRLKGEGTVGIYLKDASASALRNPGTILTDTDKSVAIYADNAEISGTLDLRAFDRGVGLYAAGDQVRFSDAVLKTAHMGLYVPGQTGEPDGLAQNTPGWTLTGIRVEAGGRGSVGIYTENPDLIYAAETVVTDGGVGIVVAAGAKLTAKGGSIRVDGADSTGILIDGGTADLGVSGDMSFTFGEEGGTGIIVQGGGNLLLGGKLSVTGDGVLVATENGDLGNAGTITAEGSAALFGQYEGGQSGTLTNSGEIIVTKGGYGMAAVKSGNGQEQAGVAFTNSGRITASGKNGENSSVGIYSDRLSGAIDGGEIKLGDDAVGVYIRGGEISALKGNIGPEGNDVGNATGLYAAEGAAVAMDAETVIAAGKRGIAVGADGAGVSGINPANLSAGSGGVLLYATGGANLTATGGTLTADGTTGVLVKGSGSVSGLAGVSVKNGGTGLWYKDYDGAVNLPVIEQYGSDTTGALIEGGATGAAITAGDVAPSGTAGTTGQTGLASIGKSGAENSVNIGNIWASGKENTGVYAVYTKGAIGDITALDGALGLYSGSTGQGGLTVGNISAGDRGSAGVYAEGTGSETLKIRGDIEVGQGQSVGLYGKDLNLDVKGNLAVDRSSFGIVGAGSGNITYEGNANLGRGAVGLYATGDVSVVNYGDIHAEAEKSIGVFAGAGASFENAAGAVIRVDNSGTGVLASGAGSTALNNGTIVLGASSDPSGAENIGMIARNGGLIRNGASGVIRVSNGTAMYVDENSSLDNQGTIELLSAAASGIAGPGIVLNRGNIHIVAAGQGTADRTGLREAESLTAGDAVAIDEAGVRIGANYQAMGGTLEADIPMTLAGPIVDASRFANLKTPLFTAPDVSGVLRLSSDFALMGNGWRIKLDDFDKIISGAGAGRISVETSPMFVTRQIGGALYVEKKSYEELLAPKGLDFDGVSPFANLYRGLDNLLMGDPAGLSRDAMILKKLNAWLEEIYNTKDLATYNRETALAMAETRGDIYGNSQSRMQDVQRGFDSGFHEMESSYNIAKDSGKYSLLYGHGRFRDNTEGVPEYDYDTTGLMRMREFESWNSADKRGWYGGFAVTNFRFDDIRRVGSRSRERVYSLRAGIHGTKSLDPDNSLRFLGRLEAGYNFHDAKRTLELDRAYQNKGRYHSGQLTFDTRLEKSLVRSYPGKIDLYAGLNAEYGLKGRVKEKGEGLRLDVRGNDYLSIRPEVGVTGYRRFKTGEKNAVKLEGDLAWGRELGDNYAGNKARLRDGQEDYYNLIRPEKEKDILRGRAALTLEKADKAGITFDVEVRKGANKDKADVRCGVRFKYVFEPWG
jgi:hypothetical protein